MGSERKDLALPLFILQIATEIFTSSAIVLYRIMGSHVDKVYVIFIVMTFVRFFYWLFISYHLAGRKMLMYYIMPDTITVLGTIACFAYIGYNLRLETEYATLRLVALACYCVLIYCLNGVLRIMVKFMKWTFPRMIAYKLNRAYGVLFYMAFGIIELNRMIDQNLEEIKDLYLLFVFTTMAYLAEIYILINEWDKSKKLKYRYVIGQDEEKKEKEHGKHGEYVAITQN